MVMRWGLTFCLFLDLPLVGPGWGTHPSSLLERIKKAKNTCPFVFSDYIESITSEFNFPPNIDIDPSFQTTEPLAFEQAQLPREQAFNHDYLLNYIPFLDLSENQMPITYPNPFAIPAIQNQIAHHLSLLMRLVDTTTPIPSQTILVKMKDSWKGIKGDIGVDDIGNSWMLLTLANREARDYDGFDPHTTAVPTADLWVPIPLLPFYLQSEQSLAMIIEGNRVGKYIKVDESSNIKNKRRFVRLCINVKVPNSPGFVKLEHYDKSILTFKLWYEGFSPGCGCCGDEDHLFDDCILNNLQPQPFHFNLVGSDSDFEAAKQIKQRLLGNLLGTSSFAQNPSATTQKQTFLGGSSSNTKSLTNEAAPSQMDGVEIKGKGENSNSAGDSKRKESDEEHTRIVQMTKKQRRSRGKDTNLLIIFVYVKY
ncbi:hypothetical protein V2J09_000835 [Rumex salicifolius]